MNIDHRIAISKGQSNDDARWFRALHKSGFTQASMADKLGISRPLMSMYRNGSRRVPRKLADRVFALTGWTATARNWRGGIAG